ncbi:hypothetical protein GOBAR_DD19183 [Gossypium barbadense]|nr:hypothetical protein GOBAR_DD19183 [Gossypium barbadense]
MGVTTQLPMPPSRESGDRGWPSTPNTRPRFSNLGQSEFGPSQFNAQDGPIGGGPRSGVEQHAYRPQPSGPNGGGVRPTFENNVYRPQSSGPNGGGPNGGLTRNFGPIDGFGPNDGIGLSVTNPVSNNSGVDVVPTNANSPNDTSVNEVLVPQNGIEVVPTNAISASNSSHSSSSHSGDQSPTPVVPIPSSYFDKI